MRDDGGQWTSCVPYTRSEGDFAWTGVRLTAGLDATLVHVAPAQANGVRVVSAWVAAADHAAGAFVPWSEPRVPAQDGLGPPLGRDGRAAVRGDEVSPWCSGSGPTSGGCPRRS